MKYRRVVFDFNRVFWPLHGCAMALAAAGALSVSAALAGESGAEIPTGQTITPRAAAGALFQELNPQLPTAPELRANHAAAVAVSPDGTMLAILTSGSSPSYGQDLKPLPELSREYVFLFDIAGAAAKQVQVLTLPHSYQGLTWTPHGKQLFVSGGRDDTVVELVRGDSKSGASGFSIGRTFALGHKHCVGLDNDTGHFGYLNRCGPVAAGLAVSPDGSRLLVANLENDSVSLIDLPNGRVLAEQDLRPGMIDPKQQGRSGGSFPRSVAWVSASGAYVASERDREIIALAIDGPQIKVLRRISVPGQPVALLANRAGTRIYVALATTGRLAVIDTRRHVLIESIDASAPQSLYVNSKGLGGANSNALALTPDERLLLVSNGGQNSVAVVRLSDRARGEDPRDKDRDLAGPSEVIGLVPTGWYPTGVATSKDGRAWYIVNGKSAPGPSNGWCRPENVRRPPKATRDLCIPDNYEPPAPYASNGVAALRPAHEDPWQLEKAGFLSMPAPAALELARLTKQVARNNHFDQPDKTAADQRLFAFLRTHIKHVIYVIKENRSYDQVLGDLEIGNGDPRLTLFPESISPNHHALARHFVTLDNFLVSGEGSWEGWDWSISAQTNDYRERLVAGGMAGEQTGFNRNLNLAYATSQERHTAFPLAPSDPDVLPGERDVTAPDGPGGEEGKGFLWDVALRGGISLRNWGCWGENRAFPKPDAPLVHDPHAAGQKVFFPTRSSLAPYSDPYYLDFGPAFPDFWRVKEWKREFAEFSVKNTAPRLMLVRLGNDHFGSFESAIDGVNTPDTQMADNDYALGLLIEAVAASPFAKDTLIVSIEDDAADGPDHVDARRSVALFAGAYVRQHALVSTRYTTVSVVKTIEEILGIGPIGLNDALAAPMSDLFDPSLTIWSYKAIIPNILRTTQLPLPQTKQACEVTPKRSAAYWARATAGQDFSRADHLDNNAFNHALWRGLKGDAPYPSKATGVDLSANRSRLLARAKPIVEDPCLAR